MSANWRIEWRGAGVVSNAAGVFQMFTAAYVEEALAQVLATQDGWHVTDPDGTTFSVSPQKAGKPESTTAPPERHERKAKVRREE